MHVASFPPPTQIMAQPDAEALYQQLRAFFAQQQGKIFGIGVHAGGAWIARRLASELGRDRCVFGSINASLHRDDFARRGLARAQAATHIPFAVDDADIWIVDDVLHTGRTVRAVLNELFDFGRPARVRLAVLVDRGERQLPIVADFAAMTCVLGAEHRLDLHCADGEGAHSTHAAHAVPTQFVFRSPVQR